MADAAADIKTPIDPIARPDWFLAGVFFAVALGVRLLFLLTARDRHWPHSIFYEGDAPLWIDFANALANGQPFEWNLPIHSPGVAYLLSWIGPWSLPHDFTTIKAIWCLVSALTVAAAFLAFRLEFNRRTSILGAMLCTFAFGSYVTATSLNNECPYTLMIVLIVPLTIRCMRAPGLPLAALLGLVHGAATMLRAEHSLLVIMTVAFFAITTKPARWRKRFTSIAVMCAVWFVCCLPWSVRGSAASRDFNQTSDRIPDYTTQPVLWTNDARLFIERFPAFARADNVAFVSYACAQEGVQTVTPDRVMEILLREFDYIPQPISEAVFVSSQGALSFALANHPDCDGAFCKAALANKFPVGSRLHLGLPQHLKLYSDGYRVGWKYITADPIRWLKTVRRKIRHFASGMTLGLGAHNFPIGRFGERRAVDLVTHMPGQSLLWRSAIVILTAIGAFFAFKRKAGRFWCVVIAYKLIVTILFYGYARQAVSILPAFAIHQAVAIVSLTAAVAEVIRLPKRTDLAIVSLIVTALIFGDVHSAFRPTPIRLDGTIHAAPRWGPDAVESFERLVITPVQPNASSGD